MNYTRFNATHHINNLISDSYYYNLIKIRNTVAVACDNFFQNLNAPRVDLFLICQSISSPMGKGSDSLPIEIDFGNKHSYLADSSQFGMEPLVQNFFEMVYCYLPSFRGEDPDDRHLNQFYHCEAELRGDYKNAMSISEGLVREIIKNVLEKHLDLNIGNLQNNEEILKETCIKEFPVITLDEVDSLFSKNNIHDLIEKRPYGRVLTNKGELMLTKLISDNKLPVWLTHYDRDTVPFYQKPNPLNVSTVLNADLIFPSLQGGFGGEIVGLGQRQDNVDEIYASMKSQNVNSVGSYEWYINMRRNKQYKITSGFGLGIERLIAWFLGLKSIVDVSIYPVLKNEDIV